MSITFVASGGSGETFSGVRQDGDYIFLYTYHHPALTTRTWNSSGWTKLASRTGNEFIELWYLRYQTGVSFSTTVSYYSGSSWLGFATPAVFLCLIRGLTAPPTLASQIWENGASGAAVAEGVADDSITPGDVALICSRANGDGMQWNSPSVPNVSGFVAEQLIYSPGNTVPADNVFRAVACEFGYSPSVLFPQSTAPDHQRNCFTIQVILPGVDVTRPAANTNGGTWWKWKAPDDGILVLDSLFSDLADNEYTFLFVFSGNDDGTDLQEVARWEQPLVVGGKMTSTRLRVAAGQAYFVKATTDSTGAT